MTDLLLAVGATAASATIMYAVCLRPMTGKGRRRPPAADPSQELARLRREVTQLRGEQG